MEAVLLFRALLNVQLFFNADTFVSIDFALKAENYVAANNSIEQHIHNYFVLAALFAERRLWRLFLLFNNISFRCKEKKKCFLLVVDLKYIQFKDFNTIQTLGLLLMPIGTNPVQTM